LAKPPKLTPEEEESRRILERINDESESIGRSSMRRVAENITSHMKGEDADQNEWAELWGTRIGRGLSVIAVVALLIYLYQTYFLPS